MVGINIFHIAELLYSLIFIACGFGVYFFFTKKKGGKPKSFLTKPKIAVATAVLFVMVASVTFFFASVCNIPKVLKDDPVEVYLTVSQGDEISLEGYGNYKEISELEGYQIVLASEKLGQFQIVRYYADNEDNNDRLVIWDFSNPVYQGVDVSGTYDYYLVARSDTFKIPRGKTFLVLHITIE
jgi:hypothetical protein